MLGTQGFRLTSHDVELCRYVGGIAINILCVRMSLGHHHLFGSLWRTTKCISYLICPTSLVVSRRGESSRVYVHL
jgi:hypothetical protein